MSTSGVLPNRDRAAMSPSFEITIDIAGRTISELDSVVIDETDIKSTAKAVFEQSIKTGRRMGGLQLRK